MKTKRCYRCHQQVPIDYFHANRSTTDGYDTRCKSCKRELYLEKRNKDPLSTYLTAKRSWCKQRGIFFDMSLAQLRAKWTGVCPILGIEISLGKDGKGSHNSAHLDRFDPSKGYTYDNVNWISGRANRIKYDATIDELTAIVS